MLGSPAGGTLLKGCGRVGRYALLEQVEHAGKKAIIFPEVMTGPPPQPPPLLFLCNGMKKSPGICTPPLHGALPHHRPRVNECQGLWAEPLETISRIYTFLLSIDRVQGFGHSYTSAVNALPSKSLTFATRTTRMASRSETWGEKSQYSFCLIMVL